LIDRARLDGAYVGRATLPKRRVAPIAREDFIAPPQARSYAVAPTWSMS